MNRFVTAVLAAAAFAGLAIPANAGTPIAVGRGNTSDTLPVLVAASEGIFAKNGLDVTVTAVPSPSGLLAGLFSGQFQFIMSNQVQMLTGVNGGMDLVVAAGGPRTNKENDPIALMVRSDVDYKGPEDLIGKKVAVAGLDSGTYFVLRKWLATKGVDYQKIDFVEGAMPKLGDMLKSKQVEFAAGVEPFVGLIVKDGIGRVAAKYYTEVIADQPAIFWAATREWATAHQDVIDAFRKSIQEAKAFIAANPDKAREVEKATFGANKPNLPNPDDSITPADLEVYYQIGKEIGVYDKPIDTSTLILK
jgi:NitT/TauT family transport system substrate-binding protein